jgi:hypothetical protein
MPAPPRPASRGPVLRRRALVRSSLVGVGLIALTTSGMPVALADDEESDLDTSGVQADLGGVVKPAPEVLVLDDEVVDDEVVDDQVVDDEVVEDEVSDDTGTAPAATIEGFFGRGKSVDFQIEYDDTTAPSGLDLSGAVFTLTGTGGEGTFTCTTDEAGSCSVEAIRSPAYAWFYGMVGAGPQVASESHALVPPGTYTVTQTDSAVGLTAAADSATVSLCHEDEICKTKEFEPVVNDSVFRSPVVSSVHDAVTGAPIEGAVYTLTGPGFSYVPNDDEEWVEEEPAEDSEEGSELSINVFPTEERSEEERSEEEIADEDEPDADGSLLQEVWATSAADGSLTFDWWFLPGTEYVLTPVGTVDGYQADTETTGIEIGAPTGDRPASLDPRLLAPIAVPGSVVPDPVVPDPVVPDPVVRGPVAPPAPAPSGGGTPSGGEAPAGVTAPAGREAPPVPVAPAAEPSTPASPSPSTPSASSTAGRSSGLTSSDPVAKGADQAELSTVSSSLPDRGLVMALGGLFLIAILVAFGLVRRHARRRG